MVVNTIGQGSMFLGEGAVYMGEATLGAGGGPVLLTENAILCNFGFAPY